LSDRAQGGILRLDRGASVGKLVLLVVAAFAGYVLAIAATREGAAAPEAVAVPAWFTLSGKVSRVVDGDTLIARLRLRSERVRLIGINAPEKGACYGANATAMARTLALNRRVTLQGDRTQSRRDRFGRLLAYVRLPGGRDLGRELIRAGRARVFVFNRPFARLASYRAAEAAAIAGRVGLWSACVTPPTTSTTTTTPTTTTPTTTTPTTTAATSTTTTTPTSTTITTPGNCAPSYPDVCIPPPPPDLDCGDIPYRNFRVIYTVPDPDPHRFDSDRDGIGCET
jgi:micrococcal nuclease